SSCQKSPSRNRMGGIGSPLLRAWNEARNRKRGPTQRWLSFRTSSRIIGKIADEATTESWMCHHNRARLVFQSSEVDVTRTYKNTIISCVIRLMAQYNAARNNRAP